MDSDTEPAEEWLPKVLQQWDAFMADPNRNAKKYTAFLRFAFKSYAIPATARVRKIKTAGRSYHHALNIEYQGGARTMDDMKAKLDEVRELVWRFKAYGIVTYDYCRGSITYSHLQIWE